MTKYTIVGATVFSLLGGAVSAQPVPPQGAATLLTAPPAGTLSTSDTKRTIDGNGTETNTNQTTYRNPAGVAEQVDTTRTTHPAITTTTGSTTTTTTR